MKLKNLILQLALFLLFIGGLSAQANKGLHQFFVLDGAYEKVELNLKSEDIKVQRVAGSRVIIETFVTLGTPNTKMLDYLAEKGRYELQANAENADATLQIAHKAINNKIIVQGQECSETFKYIIYIPESVKFVSINGNLNDDTINTTVASSK